ncbi:MAG: hypothetical protein V3V96_17435 [Acidiferrobacterales bacterium]
MTDRIAALTVHLASDVRDDDVQGLVDAIAQFRGVLKIDPRIATTEDHMARVRVRHELRKRLFEALADD